MSSETTGQRLKRIGEEFVSASNGRYLSCHPKPTQNAGGEWDLCFRKPAKDDDDCLRIIFFANISDDEIRKSIGRELNKKGSDQ